MDWGLGSKDMNFEMMAIEGKCVLSTFSAVKYHLHASEKDRWFLP